MWFSVTDLEACGSGPAAGLRIREAFSEEEAARQGLTDSAFTGQGSGGWKSIKERLPSREEGDIDKVSRNSRSPLRGI